MPRFRLALLSPDGIILQEVVEFRNKEEAESAFAERGFTVLECKRELPLPSLPFFGRGKVSKQELADFCFYFGRALDMGLPILEATEDIKNSVRNKSFREKLERLRELLMAGESISTAMKEVGGFPPELVGLVKLGGFLGRAGDDKGGAGFVYEDVVHLVNDGVVQLPLDALG